MRETSSHEGAETAAAAAEGDNGKGQGRAVDLDAATFLTQLSSVLGLGNATSAVPHTDSSENSSFYGDASSPSSGSGTDAESDSASGIHRAGWQCHSLSWGQGTL